MTRHVGFFCGRQNNLAYFFQISRIEQESFVHNIPNKPPPPYTPPGSSPTAGAPSNASSLADQLTSVSSRQSANAKPKSVNYVTNSRAEVVKVLKVITEAAYEVRQSENTSTAYPSVDHLESLLDRNDGDQSERGRRSRRMFIQFLTDFAAEIVDEVYASANPTKPRTSHKARQAFPVIKAPASADELFRIVEREALVNLGFEKKSKKENLIVRWSLKKRDKVDHILVRELHAEEAKWTDYTEDEMTVKNRVAQEIWDALIDDTLLELVTQSM
jgi:hypothetical protein